MLRVTVLEAVTNGYLLKFVYDDRHPEEAIAVTLGEAIEIQHNKWKEEADESN